VRATNIFMSQGIDCETNWLALLGAGIYGLTPDEAFNALGIGYKAKLPKETLARRDAKIIYLRDMGLRWDEVGRTMGIDKQTARKAYARRMNDNKKNNGGKKS